ncbi:immunoglobulin-like and fibronectin type III domain-containing protein 1 isoform X1 [Alosa sapidissima]|uniref:immunoglobulin-like and fibronectin type III domain-containing protein 1 isoform X1 n=1 Tax=Alosa sapidissima TaxID=34773 RepID=UPI001C0A42BA|nr:immunoglobulin-like and fibronectin type III domain-containing protein 1 isoform X1 [Alosa sapidissima]
MWKRKAKVTDQTADGQGPAPEKKYKKKVGIKKKSKVPGVMITQYVEELPEGKSHPDFTRKPIALTIQEGKLAIFKAIVTGDPEPTVTWARNNGEVTDKEKYQSKFDPNSHEHTLEMPNVSSDQADTYKCYAKNEFGKAIVTVMLNVIEVGFKKKKAQQQVEPEVVSGMKPVLRKSKVKPKDQQERKDGELDPKFWEILLSADKKDYERICQEYGVTNFRWMLKKLNEMKKEREEEQAQFVKTIENLKPIKVNASGCASFELEMELLEASSRIFIYKDGEMVPFSLEVEDEVKHELKQVGKKYTFTIRDLLPDDAGLYQMDVEGVTVFSTDFKIPSVDFLVKIQEVKAMEREDAVFECVLSNPFSKINWFGKNAALEAGEKFDIEVSEDKLVHRLVVKDCMMVDKGIYAAVAGIKSCNAFLVVEADKDPALHGKKKARKTTKAGGSGLDLEKIAKEQQDKLQKDRAERIEAVKAAKEATVADGSGSGSAAPEPKSDADSGSGSGGGGDLTKKAADDGAAGHSKTVKDGSAVGLGSESQLGAPAMGHSKTVKDGSAVGLGSESQLGAPAMGHSKSVKDGSAVGLGSESQLGAPAMGGKGDGSDADGAQLGSGTDGSGSQIKGAPSDEKVSLTQGLSDAYAIRGKPVEMALTLSSDKPEGTWYKDGEKLSSEAGKELKKDGAIHKLMIQSAKDDHSGQYAFETAGIKTEASLTVGDVPEFDPDDLHKFSKPVIVKVGQNGSFKMPFEPQENLEIKWFKDGVELNDGGGVKIQRELNHSRLLMKDCIRSDAGEIKIKLKNPFGEIEATSRLIVLDKPGPPEGPVEVVESTSTVIELQWKPPKDDGGSAVTNYIIERQQVGQPMWKKLGDVTADRLTFRDRNVIHGKNYIYRIYAENPEGIGEPLVTESTMAGTLVFPGPPCAPKVESAFKNCINLKWEPPLQDNGTQILGYQLEKRKKDTQQWIALNPVNEPIEGLKYAVKDVSEGSEYEFRVAAINVSGAGDPSPPSQVVAARNPKMRPQFHSPEDFMVIRAGNSLRIKMTYEAEPQPDITWLKDEEPISPWINILNVEGSSTLVIPSSQRSDSGIYTIIAKNSSGSANFDIEVRVTDEPKQPGPVALEQLVHGKVIITWEPSPDQEVDDRLHYMVAEHESNTRIWRTIADRLFCNTFTANVHSGREYHFRVYAKNDMGPSDPSNSPTWGVNSNKVAATTNAPVSVSLERPPSIMVPLKVHTPPKGYQCFMTCAVRGFPTPYVFWYLNDICINDNKNYYITNAHGICSMYILRVSATDGGVYKVVAINNFGTAECSTKVSVKD